MDFLVTNNRRNYKKFFHRHESTQNNTLHFESKLFPLSGEPLPPPLPRPNFETQLAKNITRPSS